MIPVEKAIQRIDIHIEPTKEIEILPVEDTLGFVLAKDVTSPIAMPPFRQSAMDGYALGSIEEKSYTLVGEVQAGDHKDPTLQQGEAVRIFTGAPVPSSAKAVMMQEKVTLVGNTVHLKTMAKANENIRPQGEQIQQGAIALTKETKITAAGIGYLTTLGITHIEVYKKPTIAIIATGNELVPPGQDLKYGQIYESNSTMLSAALKTNGFDAISFYKVADEYETTKSVIDKAIQQHDVVLISGGISVGDYDFVGKALHALHVEEIFYKVRQKPGKPLYFSKKEGTAIFALPGNPASSLSCFYVYVLPALQKITGLAEYHLKRSTAISNSEYSKKGERAEFLKAILKDNKATILDGQASSMLRSFALANALVYLPEGVSEVHPGDTLQVINLP